MRYLMIVVVFLFLVACGSSPDGNQFLGEWSPLKKGQKELTISKEGENFILTQGKDKIPCTYSDQKLVASGLMGDIQILFNNETDHIKVFALGKEYEFERKK